MKPQILMLVHRVPYPPNRGDRIRSYHLLRFLAKHADVHLATLADEPIEPTTRNTLESLCARVAIEPLGAGRWVNGACSLLRGGSATEGLFYCGALHRTVSNWSQEQRFDGVVVFCSSMVPYLKSPGLRNIPTVIDLVDVDSQKFMDYAASTNSWKGKLYAWEGRRLRKLESTLPRRASAITLVTEAEADIYRTFCPNEKTFAVGNGVDVEYYQPQNIPTRPQHCVFVGAFDYRPNIEGAVWFCEHVWPVVLRRYPQAIFTLVGRNPDVAVKRLTHLTGVRVTGTVPDVRPYVAEAEVALAPLRIARGVQNKVLEAMAMEKPTIVSPQALEGLRAEVGKELFVAEHAEDWMSCLIALFEDRKLRESSGLAARNFVLEHHGWERCLDALSEWLPLASGRDSVLLRD